MQAEPILLSANLQYGTVPASRELAEGSEAGSEAPGVIIADSGDVDDHDDVRGRAPKMPGNSPAYESDNKDPARLSVCPAVSSGALCRGGVGWTMSSCRGDTTFLR